MCHEVRSRVLVGPLQEIAMRFALEKIITEDLLRQKKRWKLFTLLPRMLLHRPPRRGVVERGKLIKRFDQLNKEASTSLVEASRTCYQQDAVVRRQRSRRGDNDLRRRVDEKSRGPRPHV